MKKNSRFALLLFVLTLFSASAARAAQVALVDVDGTPFMDGPQKKANVLFTLKKGQRLDISNYPTEGFYKARTMDHKIGWVSADSLDLQKSKTTDPSGEESDKDDSDGSDK